MTTEQLGWLRLHLTPGLGRVGLLRLMRTLGDPETILNASPVAWQAAGVRPAIAAEVTPLDHPRCLEARRSLEQCSARIVSLDDPLYPARLKTIHDPPALLYLRGNLPETPALAVVGARRASDAGRRFAGEVCSELAAHGVTVVSGLARGIDTAAHQGALLGGGPTVAVLGCGIDQVYPPENARLFDEVVVNGAILSEYPPGTEPLPGHFPGRNRIISGLCQGVMVVEAAGKSGSLITAEFALEQGREVFAVPAPVYCATGEGVNRLLKDGAHLVTCAKDILEVLHITQKQRSQEIDPWIESLQGDELALYLCLDEEPRHVDELARKCGLTPMGVSAILLHLELQGGVEQLPGMRYARRQQRRH
ncbi:MAG TPA: DNA-processing protein DprA [Desulfuromonadales bacterium]|nr:DNA-processing protein DprA [Desulfuromonadales bacterium]